MSTTTYVSCIRKGGNTISDVPFDCLRAGDKVFSGGDPVVVGQEAHYSGDASYDGSLFYDEEGNSWFPEDLESGVKPYALAVADGSEFYIPNAVHIERVDAVWLVEDDVQAARLAEQDGVKLIHDMPHVAPGVYVDTLENRAVIKEMLEKYPEYKDVGCRFTFDPKDMAEAQKRMEEMLELTDIKTLRWNNHGCLCEISKASDGNFYYDLRLSSQHDTMIMAGESVEVLQNGDDAVKLNVGNDAYPICYVPRNFFEQNFTSDVPRREKGHSLASRIGDAESRRNQMSGQARSAPSHTVEGR